MPKLETIPPAARGESRAPAAQVAFINELKKDSGRPAHLERDWRRTFGAALVSFLAHAILIVSLAVLGLKVSGRNLLELVEVQADPDATLDLFDDPGGAGDAKFEMRELLNGDVKTEEPSLKSEAAATRSEANMLDSLNKGAPASRTSVGTSVGEGIESGAGKQGGGGGGGGDAQFGKLRAQGKRIVYVIDRSASMNNHRAIEYAKEALIKSIRDLSVNMEFQVVLYSDEADLLLVSSNRQYSLVPASEMNKDRAAKLLFDLRGDGGTRHDRGLEKALQLKPEVMFLLTDAEDDSENDIRRLVKRIADYNAKIDGRRVTVHVMQYWHQKDKPANKAIQELATATRGSYDLVLPAED